MINMKLKRLTAIAAIIVLSGCSNHDDADSLHTESGSTALRFARAMNLHLMADRGKEGYLIYNQYTNNTVTALPSPLIVDQQGNAQRLDNSAAEVNAGFIAHNSILKPSLAQRQEGRAPVPEGLVRIASWNHQNEMLNVSKMRDVFLKYIPLFSGFSSTEYCTGKVSHAEIRRENLKVNASLQNIDMSALPRPPLKRASRVQFYGFNTCFSYLAQQKSNLPVFAAMSRELGENWAIFVPGSQQHQPWIFNEGRAYPFAKEGESRS